MKNEYVKHPIATSGCLHRYTGIAYNGCKSYLPDCKKKTFNKICCCNETFCDTCCCKKDCRHLNVCNDVFESIALQEAAIANILNMDGEKLQKIMAQSDDVRDILAVNESVQKTIVNATHLEQVLFNKLDLLTKCCGFCENKACNPHKGCMDITPCKIDGGKV